MLSGYVMTDSNIRTAVAAWIDDDVTLRGGDNPSIPDNHPTPAEAVYGHISTFDTSGVTDMSYLFCGSSRTDYSSYGCSTAAASFNEDISAWDTSLVTNMNSMFANASIFNQDIGAWSVGAVTDMSYTFYEASSFNSF